MLHKKHLTSWGKFSALAVMLASLTACFQTNDLSSEAIDYRQNRFDQMETARQYDACIEEALQRSNQAKLNKSPGQYLTSARLLQDCETGLGNHPKEVALENRMRHYALSILNQIKGGDLGAARDSLSKFQTAFPDRDLYYRDGSSFLATMQALLGEVDKKEFGRFSLLNINRDMKAEMRRMLHWAQS